MSTKKSNAKVSFEFFPPRTSKGMEKLRDTGKSLLPFSPEYFSVTFGAGGSTQETTKTTIIDLKKHFKVPVTPHISCISSTKAELRSMLQYYKDQNITSLVALRGDLPPGTQPSGELQYATDLVKFIKDEMGDHFSISVGAYPEFHPEAENAKRDLMYFKDKVDAGADKAITQYFYNIDAYARFVDNCRNVGIDIPIIPGIMPIYNCQQLERFSDVCGAELPRWIRKELESIQDDENALIKFGIDVVTELSEKLIDMNVPELHYYTLNRSDVMLKIAKNLGL